MKAKTAGKSNPPRLSRGPEFDCWEEWPEVIGVPPPLAKRQKFPAWFNELIAKLHPEEFEGISPEDYGPLNLLTKLYPGLHRCFDHWGTAFYGRPGEEKEWLILEPYPLVAEDLRVLLKFTDDFGLGFNIQAGSSHQPCKTLRVMIRPRGGWEEKFLQRAEAYR
jgi:hypothetical protein